MAKNLETVVNHLQKSIGRYCTSTSRVVLTILVSSFWLIQFSGCSLLGLGVGALSDRMSPDEYMFTPAGLDSIEQGSLIEVNLLDGSLASGEYDGIDNEPAGDYSERYRAALGSLPSGHWMPALGDSILILTHGVRGRKAYAGRLLGFEDGIVRVQPSNTVKPIGVFVEAVDSLFNGGTVMVPGTVLRGYMSDGGIPFMIPSVMEGVVLVRDSQGISRIPMRDVVSVRQPAAKKRWLQLLVSGAALDATWLIIWAINGCKLYDMGQRR